VSMKLSFCVKAAKDLNAQDLDAITASIEHYQRAGMDTTAAETAAIDDLMASIKADRTEMVGHLRDQHQDLFKSDRPALPATPQKQRKAPTALRGSLVLGTISNELGGLSPELLPDLSQKVTRTRTSKLGKTTSYIVWDNPPATGVGPLFRAGGTTDLAEVARALEEAGYLTAGTVEADGVGAAQQAGKIVQAELAKPGSTLQVGNADAIDAAARARQEGTAEPWDSFMFEPDDLDASGYNDLNADERATVEALVQEADAVGIDTEALKDGAVRQTEGESDHAYLQAVQSAVRTALLAHRGEIGQPAGAQSRPGDAGGQQAAGDQRAAGGQDAGRTADRPDLELTSHDTGELKAKAARDAAALAADKAEQKRLADKAEADKQREEFTLTGSDRKADQNPDQGVMFDLAGPTDTADFKKWFGDSKVVDAKGKPLVLYHGTTADFHTFDRAKGNIEADMGAGFYFTNTPADVAANYAGEGPDLTQKIELRAERIQQEMEDDGAEDATMERARELARKEFSEHAGATMPVYLKIENPLRVGGKDETHLTYETPFDEETDEYGEEHGTLVDVLMALQGLESQFEDFNYGKLMESIGDDVLDGMPASKFIEKAKASEGLMHATDENGTMASTEILRQAFEEAGFDGIIDSTVNEKFGSERGTGVKMKGMKRGTVHYIAFEPTQIKSAIGNKGTFDATKGDIRLSENPDFQDTQQLERPEVTEGAPAQQDVDALAKIEASFRGKVDAFKGLKLTAMPRMAKPGNKATEAERQRYAAADLAEKLFGKRVVFFNANMQFANGLQADYLPGMIFVSENTTRPIQAVLGHELTHAMRADDPKLYDKLSDRLRGMLEEPGRYGEQLNARRAARGLDPLNFDKLREELIADIVGDNFTDPQFWKQMAKGQPSLFGRVLRVIKDFFDDLLAKLRNERPYGTGKYLNDVQAARDAVVEAMSQFAASPKTAAAAVVTAAEANLSQAEPVQTDSAAFKKWFGDSKVVDSKGTPLVVYHGTSAGDIHHFDAYASNYGLFGQGSYFTADPSIASEYTSKGKGASATVYPAYLSIKNAIDMDGKADRALWEKGYPEVDFDQWTPDGDTNEAFYRAVEDELSNQGVPKWEGAEMMQDGLRNMGFDGITHMGGGRVRNADTATRHRVFIVFDPEQVKSSIGNNGEFDASKPEINMSLPDYTHEEREALERAGINTRSRFQRAGDRIHQGYEKAVDALRGNWARQFQQGALDQFHGIDQAVRREIGALPTDQDPYVAARLANGGTSSVMRGLMLHGQAKWAANGQHLEKIAGSEGLLDILKPLDKDLNSFFGWMIGNRAARLMREGRENNFTPEQIKALQGLNKGKEDAFRKAALGYAAFKRSVLDVAEQAGLLDPESRKVWDNADYIPFYREIDDKAVFGATGKKGLSGQSSGIRTLKGGEAALNDPMENILMNFSRLIDASLKNRALSKTIDTLTAAKSDVVQKVGYEMSKQLVPADQVRKQLAEAGTPQQVLDIIPPEAFEGMAKMWSIQAPTDPTVVRIMVGGKPQFYKVNDPLLLKALTSFVPFDFPGLGVARAFKRVLTGMVTATPEFMARNFIRDTAATAIITRHGFNPAKSLSGIVKSYREAGAYEDMLFAGASFQTGDINASDPTATGKAMRRALRSKGFDASSAGAFVGSIIDTPAKFWDKYRHVGEAIENSNREAVYEATTKAGRGATAAAFEAKDMMDFTLRGSSPMYQLLADVLPFFNARVQGLYRLGRADPKRVAMYGTLMMLASLALAYANGDNDDYDKLPDWDKETYWHFWIKGEHFRMPKPFELGAVFASVPERIMRYIRGQDTGKKTLGRVWAILRDQLAFDPAPQMIRPALNAWANKDTFRDRPLENQGDEGKLPSQRYSKVTSPTAVAATKAIAPIADEIGLSPKKLEYLVGGYLGTAGLYALGLSDFAIRALDKQAPPRPETRLDQVPLIGSFYRQEPAFSTVYETDLYKMRAEVEQVYKSVRALQKDDKAAEADALIAKNEKLLEARKALEHGGKALGSLNKARDAIYADKEMTPKQKRAALEDLLRQRADVSKQVMKSEGVVNAQ